MSAATDATTALDPAKVDALLEDILKIVHAEFYGPRPLFDEELRAAVMRWARVEMQPAASISIEITGLHSNNEAQQAASHPEDNCERCGRENACWFAPSEVWNLACKDHSILCPVCFIKLTEQSGLVPTSWKIEPENLGDRP